MSRIASIVLRPMLYSCVYIIIFLALITFHFGGDKKEFCAAKLAKWQVGQNGIIKAQQLPEKTLVVG